MSVCETKDLINPHSKRAQHQFPTTDAPWAQETGPDGRLARLTFPVIGLDDSHSLV